MTITGTSPNPNSDKELPMKMTDMLIPAPEPVTIGGPGLNIATISTSLSAESVSRMALGIVETELRSEGVTVTRIDVADLPATMIGRGPTPAEWSAAETALAAADAVVIAFGVHGYSMSGSSKVAVEMLGEALVDKPVAFVMASGTERSHMAVTTLATSLVIERGVHWFPVHVQVTGESVKAPEFGERATELARRFVAFTCCLVAAG